MASEPGPDDGGGQFGCPQHLILVSKFHDELDSLDFHNYGLISETGLYVHFRSVDDYDYKFDGEMRLWPLALKYFGSFGYCHCNYDHDIIGRVVGTILFATMTTNPVANRTCSLARPLQLRLSEFASAPANSVSLDLLYVQFRPLSTTPNSLSFVYYNFDSTGGLYDKEHLVHRLLVQLDYELSIKSFVQAGRAPIRSSKDLDEVLVGGPRARPGKDLDEVLVEVIHHGLRGSSRSATPRLWALCIRPTGKSLTYLVDLSTDEQYKYEGKLPRSMAHFPRRVSEFVDIFFPARPWYVHLVLDPTGADESDDRGVVLPDERPHTLVVNEYRADEFDLRVYAGINYYMHVNKKMDIYYLSILNSKKNDKLNEYINLLGMKDMADQIVDGSWQLKRLKAGEEFEAFDDFVRHYKCYGKSIIKATANTFVGSIFLRSSPMRNVFTPPVLNHVVMRLWLGVFFASRLANTTMLPHMHFYIELIDIRLAVSKAVDISNLFSRMSTKCCGLFMIVGYLHPVLRGYDPSGLLPLPDSRASAIRNFVYLEKEQTTAMFYSNRSLNPIRDSLKDLYV
ncbi:hypothetical protein PHYSODRAFT_342440 [Phytophthora sojae]|uniref:Uncharacterized protein n=1 Tax=Phytophthora sojae (strain P6497) TaxID=1094619 RepID=G5AGJ4_PHYSP|nr:hypothetical protein PHYSODRAFT_342440 [Phytophthora sojae]EGZ05274.1 hypothetical protein PHYSODRAFT_342440 [Phytophthora sojae]|eukprot:XP_009539195.1 hypothetical protein PHYSODRAFT_342440 [Phytophthora sojae]